MNPKSPNNPYSPEERKKALEILLSNSLKSSPTSTLKIEQQAEDLLDKISSQQKINNFIDQYVVTEDFMNKVRRYARQEFDSMLLKVFIWIISIVLGTVIANLLLRK